MRGDGIRNGVALRLAKRRCPGLEAGVRVRLDPTARIRTRLDDRVTLGDECAIEPGAILYTHGGEIHIGRRTLVGPYCALYGSGGIRVGNDVLIGPHSVLVAGNHRFDRLDLPIREQGDDLIGIRVESDVWIAAHAVILDGVTVGSGSVIAAGAVVNRDVPPFAVVAGVPCRVIADRRELSMKSER